MGHNDFADVQELVLGKSVGESATERPLTNLLRA